MSGTPETGPATGRGTLHRLRAWCRRNPAVAALSGLIIVLMMSASVTNTLFAVRLAELKRENEELRRELESLRKAAPPRTVP
jgi:hypothetical protein